MKLTESFNRMLEAISESELRQNTRIKRKILKIRFLLHLFEKIQKQAERRKIKDETEIESIHEV